MWSEPLTNTSASSFSAYVTDAAGLIIATVRCAVSREARCGYFGSMEVLDTDGGPRQVARALVLLVRTSLAHAASLGIQHVETDIPKDANASLRDFARRMSGVNEDEWSIMRGDLAAIRSHNLDTTDDQGNERS